MKGPWGPRIYNMIRIFEITGVAAVVSTTCAKKQLCCRKSMGRVPGRKYRVKGIVCILGDEQLLPGTGEIAGPASQE
ncbi:hypothetical protein TWF192_005917 [Orbilia oligospora]|nr:hypothetical protein TWF192_005917 [Orbilia oligospora]